MRFCRHPSNEQNHPTTDAAVRDLVRSRSLGEKVVPGTKRKQVVKFVLCERNLCEAEIHVRLTRSRKKEVETNGLTGLYFRRAELPVLSVVFVQATRRVEREEEFFANYGDSFRFPHGCQCHLCASTAAV